MSSVLTHVPPSLFTYWIPKSSKHLVMRTPDRSSWVHVCPIGFFEATLGPIGSQIHDRLCISGTALSSVLTHGPPSLFTHRIPKSSKHLVMRTADRSWVRICPIRFCERHLEPIGSQIHDRLCISGTALSSVLTHSPRSLFKHWIPKTSKHLVRRTEDRSSWVGAYLSYRVL